MISAETNDILTQTGPGTPMGDLFRRYWLPVLLADELPSPDCPPVRVKLLSERLLAFRDSKGALGLIDEFCAHRGVSLWFGRNEDAGIRCPYHGWKYDVQGQCTEVPSEPLESGYCNKIKLKSYPLVELGGALWTYMGPPEHQPPLPAFEFCTVPPEQRYVSKRLLECNYLQGLEGGIDSSHTSFLHAYSLGSDWRFSKGPSHNSYNLNDLKPIFEVSQSESGLNIGVRRNAEEGHFYWRVTPWIMPTIALVPPRGDHPSRNLLWTPIDNESSWTWSFDYHPRRPMTDHERMGSEGLLGPHEKYVPGTYRSLANKDNDYMMDRAAQQAKGTYSGVECIAVQDQAVQESMGLIQDRTKENLVSTDNGIIMARQRLVRAAKALRVNGTTPPGTLPSQHRVRPVSKVFPASVPYKTVVTEIPISLTEMADASLAGVSQQV